MGTCLALVLPGFPGRAGHHALTTFRSAVIIKVYQELFSSPYGMSSEDIIGRTASGLPPFLAKCEEFTGRRQNKPQIRKGITSISVASKAGGC